MQASAGTVALTGWIELLSFEATRPTGAKPRMVAATATAIASRVMTVSAPLATDFSARNSVIENDDPEESRCGQRQPHRKCR